MSAADILGGLLQTNLAAGAAILIVVAARKWVRPRFGARLGYGLWLLPALAAAAVLLPARQVIVAQTAPPPLAAAAPFAPALLESSPIAAAGLDPLALLTGVWLAGVVAAVLVMVRLQHRFVRRARAGAAGPAVVGVIAPRIITPQDFAERFSRDEQALVLAHERAHIARQDSRLNGLCAAVQCLCWFNPLVHVAARLMRIDQELACDEAVVSRFPEARRAYAEVLVKSQLTALPLPLGCYWPSRTRHPLVERVAMLRRRDIGPARRLAGLASLAALCVGAGVAAWAAQPADVRIVLRPAYAGDIAPPPRTLASRDGLAAQTPSYAAAKPTRPVAGHVALDQVASEVAATLVRARPGGGLPTSNGTMTDAAAAASASAQQTGPLQAEHTPSAPAAGDAGRLQLANLQPSQPLDRGAADLAQLPVPAPMDRAGAAEFDAADSAKEKVCFSGKPLGSRREIQFCMIRTLWIELGKRHGARLCFSGTLPGQANAEQFCMDRRYWSKVEQRQHASSWYPIAANSFPPSTEGASGMTGGIDISTSRPQ